MSQYIIQHLFSQLVRLEGKHDFEGNRDFQTLKGLTLVQLLVAGWVQKDV